MDLYVSALHCSGSGVACSELYAEGVVSGSCFAVVLDDYLEVGGCAIGSSYSLDCYCVSVEEDTSDERCSKVQASAVVLIADLPGDPS